MAKGHVNAALKASTTVTRRSSRIKHKLLSSKEQTDGFPNQSNDRHSNQSNDFHPSDDGDLNQSNNDGHSNQSKVDGSSVGRSNQSKKQPAKKNQSKKQPAKKNRKIHISPFMAASALHDDLKAVDFSKKSAECTVREAIEEHFPAISNPDLDDWTKVQFENLITCIDKLIKKKTGQSKALLHDCEIICDTIQGVYPQAEMFDLIKMWSKPPPRDYKQHLIGALFTMNRHFPGKYLTDFLYQSRAIRVYPQTKERKRLQIICHGIEGTIDEPFENAVKKLDATLRLTHAHLRSDNLAMFNSYRFASVHQSGKFLMPMKEGASVPNGLDKSYLPYNQAAPPPPFKRKSSTGHSNHSNVSGSSDGDQNHSNVDGSSSTGHSNHSNVDSSFEGTPAAFLRLDMAPFAALHMPRSFNNRIWLTNDTTLMSFLMFRFIFYKALLQDRHWGLYEEYGMNADEKILQFLFNAATGRKDRYLWIKMLYNLALMFDSVQKIESISLALDNRSFFATLLKDGQEKQLNTELDSIITISLADRVSMIVNCYQFLNNHSKAFSVHFSQSKMRNHKFGDDKNYQAVRGWVFQQWLRFDSKDNRLLKKKVFMQMNWWKPGGRKKKVNSSQSSTVASPEEETREVERLSALATANKNVQLVPLAQLLRGRDGHPNQRNHSDTVFDSDPSDDGQLNLSNDSEPLGVGHRTESNDLDPLGIGHPIQSNNLRTYGYYLRDENIESLQIVSKDYLNSKIRSVLNVHTTEEKYELHLAPVEVYSAGNLRDREHGRRTTLRSQYAFDPDCLNVSTVIPSGVLSYVDAALSVVRPLSTIFQGATSLCLDYKSILRLIAVAGEADTKRRKQWSSSLEFGVKAELFHQSPGGFLYGDQHFSTEALPKEERERARASIARIMDFLWEIGDKIEMAIGRTNLGGNRLRSTRFGYPVGAMFGTIKSEFESVTIAHSILYPESAQCSQHTDDLNDKIGGYDKTLCLDLALVGQHGEIHLLQVLCNFRSSCRDRLHSKITERVKKIKEDIQTYELNLRKKYNICFNEEARIPKKGVFSFLRDAFNLDHFFLSDELNFQPTEIAKNKGIFKDLLMLPIGSSRLISLSMAIDPVYSIRDDLKTNQLVEICFFASFVSATTTLSHVLWSLVKDGSLLVENIHPFVLLKDRFAKLFDKVHTGIQPRYSSSSNRFLDLVEDKDKIKNNDGKVDGNDDEEVVEETIQSLAAGNTAQLDTICAALLEYMDFIDDKADKDISYPDMNKIINSTLGKIKVATHVEGGSSLDFGHFRLSIFTSWVTGLGLLIPGTHLHQIITPAPNTASLKHLLNPHLSKNFNYNMVNVDVDYEMKVVSQSLGFPTYRRDLIEVLLCESKPGRDLRKCDVFTTGQSLFRLNDQGVVQVKIFGDEEGWEDVKPKGSKYW